MAQGSGVPETRAELAQAVNLLREVLRQNAPIKDACDVAAQQLDVICSGSRRVEASEAITKLGIAGSGTATIAEQVRTAIEKIEEFSRSL